MTKKESEDSSDEEPLIQKRKKTEELAPEVPDPALINLAQSIHDLCIGYQEHIQAELNACLQKRLLEVVDVVWKNAGYEKHDITIKCAREEIVRLFASSWPYSERVTMGMTILKELNPGATLDVQTDELAILESKVAIVKELISQSDHILCEETQNIPDVNECILRKLKALSKYLDDKSPDLEKRRPSNAISAAFWKAIDGILQTLHALKFSSKEKSTMGVAGATLSKNISTLSKNIFSQFLTRNENIKKQESPTGEQKKSRLKL